MSASPPSYAEMRAALERAPMRVTVAGRRGSLLLCRRHLDLLHEFAGRQLLIMPLRRSDLERPCVRCREDAGART